MTFLAIPNIVTVLSPSTNIEEFIEIISRIIRRYSDLLDAEKSIVDNIRNLAFTYNVACKLNRNDISRRRMMQIMYSFEEAANILKRRYDLSLDNATTEESKKNFHQLMSVLEFCGNIIICPSKLEITERDCENCCQFYMDNFFHVLTAETAKSLILVEFPVSTPGIRTTHIDTTRVTDF